VSSFRSARCPPTCLAGSEEVVASVIAHTATPGPAASVAADLERGVIPHPLAGHCAKRADVRWAAQAHQSEGKAESHACCGRDPLARPSAASGAALTCPARSGIVRSHADQRRPERSHAVRSRRVGGMEGLELRPGPGRGPWAGPPGPAHPPYRPRGGLPARRKNSGPSANPGCGRPTLFLTKKGEHWAAQAGRPGARLGRPGLQAAINSVLGTPRTPSLGSRTFANWGGNYRANGCKFHCTHQGACPRSRGIGWTQEPCPSSIRASPKVRIRLGVLDGTRAEVVSRV
jgi:hypothetical protein